MESLALCKVIIILQLTRCSNPQKNIRYNGALVHPVSYHRLNAAAAGSGMWGGDLRGRRVTESRSLLCFVLG